MTAVTHQLDAGRALLEAGRDPLAATVSGALSSRCGVEPGSRLLVGFSGGPDSTALLLLLLALSEHASPPCARPEVLHVDHGLRDASADEEELVVSSLDSTGREVTPETSPVVSPESSLLVASAVSRREFRLSVLPGRVLSLAQMEYIDPTWGGVNQMFWR